MRRGIAVFYHLWCTNHWEEVLQEHLDSMISSSLYDAATSITIGYISDAPLVLDAYPKIRMVRHGADHKLYEFPTLRLLHRHAQQSDDNLLYFHSKGVSVPRDARYDAWRAEMNDAVIARWNECHHLLWKFSAVGPRYKPGVEPYFGGNFWWAAARHVRKLPVPESLHRVDAEMWVLSSHPPAVYWIQPRSLSTQHETRTAHPDQQAYHLPP